MSNNYPFTEERPWGEFRQFTAGSPTTVKIIFVKKGESLSLQHHHLRSEFWRVISGNPEITVGSFAEKNLKTIRAKKGDEFAIEREVDHRISAPTDDAEILEISSGTFDESDIVRVEDKYGRA